MKGEGWGEGGKPNPECSALFKQQSLTAVRHLFNNDNNNNNNNNNKNNNNNNDDDDDDADDDDDDDDTKVFF